MPDAQPSGTPLGRAFAGCLAVCFFVLGVRTGSGGVSALFGAGHPMSFECTRATGECVLHDGVDRSIALATIRSADVSCENVHVSSRSYERQCQIEATLTSGETQSLAERSGDSQSEAEYRSAAAAITTFVSGSAPSLRVEYQAREGATSIFMDLMIALALVVLGVVAGAWVWTPKPKAAAPAPKVGA